MSQTRPLSTNTTSRTIQISHSQHSRAKSKTSLTQPHQSTIPNNKHPSVHKIQQSLLTRVTTVLGKIQHQQQRTEGLRLPKVRMGKLHLGKLVKPQIIIKSQHRHNPLANPNPINESLINKKGLMDIIQMGILPKNIDFTDLLNTKYTNAINNKPQHKFQNLFITNTDHTLHRRKSSQLFVRNQTSSTQKIHKNNCELTLCKAIKFKQKKETPCKQVVVPIQPIKSSPPLSIPPQVPILQIAKQRVVKNAVYYQQLKQTTRSGHQIAFKFYLAKVEQFSSRYGINQFEFKLLIDETRKISDSLIVSQIPNAKATGIVLAMKGKLQERAYGVANLIAARFRYKKTQHTILKISKVKQLFKVKKYYEEMTKLRTDLLKSKLTQFSNTQTKFMASALQHPSTAQKHKVQIHIIAISDSTLKEELTYYKMTCRNNIQLTRLFSNESDYLLLLTEQQRHGFGNWVELLDKANSHTTIVPMFSVTWTLFQSFPYDDYRVQTYDSIYYGITKAAIQTIKSICRKKLDACVFPSAYNKRLADICGTLNAKLYCGNLWQPHLDKLLNEESEAEESLQVLEQRYHSYLSTKLEKCKVSVTKQTKNYLKNEATPPSSNNANNNNKPQISDTQPHYTISQLRHICQKIRREQLNSVQLNSQHFSNKMTIKSDLLFNCQFPTPHFITFPPKSQEIALYHQFALLILENRDVKKWVLKIAISARFSRGLAFLETTSLKILKEKKKKPVVTEADISEVSLIMKPILLQKLEIPHSFLQDPLEYLQHFLEHGGYIEAVVENAASQCVFGKISVTGQFTPLGSFSKIYTSQSVNCAAMYPSSLLVPQMTQKCQQLSQVLYQRFQIFGHVTFELLVNKTNHNYYFIDLVLSLEQYSSLFFMYTAIFNTQLHQQKNTTTYHKYNPEKQEKKDKGIHHTNKNLAAPLPSLNQNKKELHKMATIEEEEPLQTLSMKRKVIYIPFIDNNGNTFQSFSQFETALALKSLTTLDFQTAEGLQFLYLNLKQQQPDVLSLLALSTSHRKALKYIMDALSFVTQTSKPILKFDKKVVNKKCDNLYFHDIIEKFKELTKNYDNQPTAQEK